MNRSEWVQTGGLGLLAGLLLLANRLRLFTPVGRRKALHALEAVPWGAVTAAAAALLLVALGAYAFWRLRRRAEERARIEAIYQAVAAGPTVFLLPRLDGRPVKPGEVQVWARMADALPHDEHLSFEIGGMEDEIAFALHGSENGVRAALTQFHAEWPGLHRKPAGADKPDPAQLPQGWSVWWVELAPAQWQEAVRPATEDPLRAVLVELNAVQGQARGLVQVIARRNFGARKQMGEMAFAARDAETPSKGVRALRQQEARRFEERARQTFLDVTLRAVGLADTPERAQGIARGLARAIAASFSGRNPVQPVRQGDDPAVVVQRQPGRMAPWAAEELAGLAHLAGSDARSLAPRLAAAPAKYLPADPEMRFDAQQYRTAFLEQ